MPIHPTGKAVKIENGLKRRLLKNLQQLRGLQKNNNRTVLGQTYLLLQKVGLPPSFC
jgi:hypothetical protein